MNTRINRQPLVITLVMMAALTFGSSLAFGQLSAPRVQANTALTLPDGSVINLTSRFRADVDTNSAGNTTTLSEATLEAEITHPPGPCVLGEHPPNPCHYMIRGETTTATAKPSLMIALLLLQHGYVTQDQITQTLGYNVIITKAACPGGCSKLPSDATVFGQLFAQVNAVDPAGSGAVAQLLIQAGQQPPGPPCHVVPGSQ